MIKTTVTSQFILSYTAKSQSCMATYRNNILKTFVYTTCICSISFTQTFNAAECHAIVSSGLQIQRSNIGRSHISRGAANQSMGCLT